MIYIVTHKKSPVLFPIGNVFYYSLKDNGYDVKHLRLREINNCRYKDRDVVIVIGAGRFPNFDEKQKQRGVKYVLWNSEPFPITPEEFKTSVYNDRFENFKRWIVYYDYYFDHTLRQYEYMNRLGFKCDGWCEVGYHKTLDFTDKYKEDFEYDVLFIGGRSQSRRIKILEEIGQRCKVYPEYDDMYGEKKIRAFFKCKIGLNIHYELLNCFEQWRIIELLSNKKLVVSELINGPISLISGKHFIQIERKDFVEKVEEVVKNYSKYQHIAVQGYDFIKNKCKFNDVTKEMMAVINAT